MAEVRIGTSGWAYGNWRGVFYPPGLRQGEWLAYYAERFNAVEVNASFYRLPREDMIRGWVSRTPSSFRFAAKAWRVITHYRRLADCEAPLEEMLERFRVFGDKLGAILFQLPPHFPADAERLQAFLRRLPARHRYAFEFRDPSWHREEIYALLSGHGAAFCPFDLAGRTAPRMATAGFVYVRLHGHSCRYRGAYPEAVLRDWADWLRGMREEGRDLWVFFDNTDEEAHALHDAARLRALLQQPSAGSSL